MSNFHTLSFFKEIGKIIKNHSFVLFEGVLQTLAISIVGTVFGVFIGFLILFMANTGKDKKRDKKGIYILKCISEGIAKTYTTVVRGTPMMVQAMIIFFGLAPYFNRSFLWSPFSVSLFIVSFNTAAYIAEIFRSGVNALDKGQYEAGRSLGMTRQQTLFKVIYPQVLRNSLPSIGNEFIVNLKDVSVLMVIGLMDLFNTAKTIYSSSYGSVAIWVFVAVIYLILTVLTSALINYLDKQRRLKKEGKSKKKGTKSDV